MVDTLTPAAGSRLPELPPSPEPAGWLRRLVGYCLRRRSDAVLAFGGALVSSSLAALTPLVARHVVDTVAAGSRASVTPWALLLVAAGVLRFAAGALRRYRAGRLGLDVQLDLRNDLLAAVQRLDGARQDAVATGQLVSRSISDLQLVQGLLFFVPNLTGNVLLFFVSLGIMLVLSPLLTLVALAVAPGLWLVATRSRRQLFPANWHAQQQAAEIAGAVEAAVTGVRVVKGFGQERRELARLERLSRSLFASRLRVVRISSVWNPLLQAVPSLGQVGILAFGGWLALRGSISLGTFLAFSAYIGSLVAPVRQLGALLVMGQQARAGVERVLEILDLQPSVQESPHARTLPADAPLGVELDDVTFGYDPDRPVLRGFSLRVRPGEAVALVGASGSGKSTVTELVSRLYDVQSGAVRVGGVDVRDLTLASLRGALGVVPEEAFLFSDTVRANLAYARPEASDEEVTAAALVAQADGFVRALPDGYDTRVGEQGLTLSGGQRQRVALARTLLADPRVLVLDDATSAIDPTTEGRIHEALRPLLAGRATLVVAHRRSTLALADRVAVLEGGRVVDVGTVDELDARSPVFRRLLSGELTPDDPGDHDDGAAEVAPAAAKPLRPTAARSLSTGAVAAPGGPGGMMAGLAAVPVTDSLRTLLDALPPATDEPAVDLAAAEASDLEFSLSRLLRPFALPLLLGLVLVGLDAAAQIAVPAIVRTAVDSGVTKHSEAVLLWAAAAAALVVSLDWGVNLLQQRVTGRTGERLLFVLRVKTFAHLQRLGLDYYERELAGRIMTRMTTDVDALSQFLQTGLTSAVISVLSLLGVLVAMLVLDAPLAGVLVATLPVLAVATFVFRRLSVPVYAESRERVSAVNAAFQEGVAGLRVTQLARREQRDSAAFAAAGKSYRDSRLRAQRYIAAYFPGVELLSEVATALVLLVGASRVREGSLSSGALIAFLLYVELFFAPVQQVSQVFDGYQQASVGLRRLRELLRTPTTTPWTADPEPVGRVRGELELDDVHFRYAEGSPEAIAGITLRIAAGEDVALVGATGAGKSTVLKLVARFYDPTSGAVRVDGVDLRRLDLEDYRQQLGYVPQEPYLFEGTVRDAIAYGRPDATDDDVRRAAEAVGADEMVRRLPGGYDAAVGERGRGLSAGQRQLLSLARAELVDPAVLLLDEATAALDLATEAAVREATARLRHRRTTLTVAHRLQSAARAGRVIVLDGGRVVEDGTHDELLGAGGAYAELWASYGAHRVTG
ncbi:ABC transporter ATP-binding protein [Motilibacter peucedani]|nr:ABC transporter ATP-binding protein [Motilibacter peucedani]